jgi:hypothetical protein
MINVKNAKTNAVVGQVSTDSHFNGRETLVRQNICSGDNWEHINPGRKSADGTNFDEG